MRGLSVAYAIVFGAVVSGVLVLPIGIGGSLQYGAWLYVGIVIAVVTLALDRLLRVPLDG